MKRYILSALILALCAVQSFGIDIFDNLHYQVRLGYNIGGTAPVGMPAEIRSLDKFKLKNNCLLGLDAYKPLTEQPDSITKTREWRPMPRLRTITWRCATATR